MNNNNNTVSHGGIGFAGLLTIVFITLKLLGVIDWSWVWVLCPLWMSVILIAVILIVVICVVLHFEGGDDSL